MRIALVIGLITMYTVIKSVNKTDSLSKSFLVLRFSFRSAFCVES